MTPDSLAGTLNRPKSDEARCPPGPRGASAQPALRARARCSAAPTPARALRVLRARPTRGDPLEGSAEPCRRDGRVGRLIAWRLLNGPTSPPERQLLEVALCEVACRERRIAPAAVRLGVVRASPQLACLRVVGAVFELGRGQQPGDHQQEVGRRERRRDGVQRDDGGVLDRLGAGALDVVLGLPLGVRELLSSKLGRG